MGSYFSGAQQIVDYIVCGVTVATAQKTLDRREIVATRDERRLVFGAGPGLRLPYVRGECVAKAALAR
jgi:hypothetical protein